jgi:quinohemoprotein amine dehydrogenase
MVMGITLRCKRQGVIGRLVFVTLLLVFCFPALSLGAEAKVVLQERCALCHKPEADGKLSRIGYQRKTPEGWLMTISRMERTQGFRLSKEERNVLVQYLSAEQGLAPDETKDFTYLLERRDWLVEEVPDPHIKATCTRCHSYGRIALDRREPQEWQLLVDFHLGTYPMAEYQFGGRNINLLSEFRQAAETLASRFPYEAQAWREWQARPPLDPTGSWLAVGYEPGKGVYVGKGEISKTDDGYRESFSLTYESGETATVVGMGSLYTGFAWRAQGKRNEAIDVRGVFHLTPGGKTMRGRWFYKEHEELGGEETRFRHGQDLLLVAIYPHHIDIRQEQVTLKIFGANFPAPLDPKDLDLGKGIRVMDVIHEGKDILRVKATISPDTLLGNRELRVVGTRAGNLLSVHRGVDYIRVLPEKGLARTGGTTAPKQLQQFEAMGFSKGADRILGTEDDFRIGPVAAQWSIAEYYRNPGEDDASYVGTVDANGLFTPAAEGPNPQRQFSTNNIGDVWVEAAYPPPVGASPLYSRAFLMVTVPRWLKPPLR